MVVHQPTSSAAAISIFTRFCSAATRRKPISAVRNVHGLVRSIGLFDAILIGIGASVGAGIFVVTGTVARDAGPGVTISYILAGAACVLNALSYAELSTRFPPVVGGAYLYTYAAFNELTAFLVFTQMIFDYHIGAASIARSLASYIVSFLELSPFLEGQIPNWIGHGGQEFFGGFISINLLAPLLLIILTTILCRGVKESSAVNSFMIALKVLVVIVVILAGFFEVDVSNWSPFTPNGYKEVATGATVVYFSYVGFDAIAHSAEELKRPQRDLPLGIMGSLLICITLYVGVCLIITGMVPYKFLGEDAPLADAFTAKGMKFVCILINIGSIVGLATTLLAGLYIQSRFYLGLARDGLLPSVFAKVHPIRHTPIHSQVWVGCVGAILGGLFNVHELSHLLLVGALTGYSTVSACVISLRWKDEASYRVPGHISAYQEGVISLATIACGGFVTGLCYRFSYSFFYLLLAVVITVLAVAALHFRQDYADAPGFSCPGVPFVPVVSIFFNMFLFAQLHEEAWVRFVLVTLITIGIYVIYGQHNANPTRSSDHGEVYHELPTEDA